jgi:hypothetical protein
MGAFSPVYFADENALGMAKILKIGTAGYIVVSRDRRIRTRPAELAAYRAHGIRSVWIGAKQDLHPVEQAELFVRHEERLRREIIKRGEGPWALALNVSGLRPIRLPG